MGRDDFDFDADALQGIDVVMCRNPAFVPAGRKIEADIYSEGTLTIGEGAVVRAALAAGDVILGKNGTVQRWLHASDRVFLGEESTFYGRLSAEQSIHMERGCSFQRVQAPGIFTVERIQSNHSDNHPDLTLPRARELELVRSGERMRVRGNFALPAGETLHAHVIATGQLHVGCGAHLHGSAKSYRDTTINDNACVHGSVVSERAVRVGSHSYVAGPLIAEREVIIGSGAMAGTADALTTVSGRRVHLGMGCQVHGTIWARDHGTVEG